MAKLRLVGAVGIKVRPDASDFRKEVEEQLRKIPNDAKIKIDVTADTDPLKRALDKAEKEEAKRTLNLKVGVEYDTLQAARRQVEGALKNLNTETIPVKLKEGDLNNALAKLKRLQRGAQVTMQFNEDKAGYQSALAKIRQIQREKAEVPITFKTDNKTLEREARKYEKLLADLAGPEAKKTITITHRNDRDSLTTAVAQIDEALAKLKEVTITPELDEPALLKARDKLATQLAKKPLVMKINEDKKGYEKVLARITELQAQAAEVDFKFKTDSASLTRAAATVRAKIAALTPKPKITFSYDTDTFGLQKSIAEVDAKLAEIRKIDLTVDLDEKGLMEAKATLEEKLKNSGFQIKLDTNNLEQLQAERKRIEELLSGKRQDLIIDVKNDETSLEETKRKLDDLIKERKAPIKAEPITFKAAMDLAYASRARDVPFYVRVNERSLAIAEGVLQSLAGINTLRESGKFLEEMITKFDTFSLKVGALSTLFGSVTDSIIYMATALFPLGEGILNLTGLLAFAPVALSALTATTLINIMAFKDFKGAIDGSAEAMAKLPIEAQRTAKSLQGAWTKIQEPVQDSFWRGMGDSMQTAMEKMIPMISKGLAKSAEHVGRFGAGVFRAFEKITFAGGPLEKMLDNLSGFFDKSAGAAEPLFNAINTLGLRGSEFLPRFGQYLTDMATRFDNWITKADEAGKITVWMEQGVQSLKDMWTMGGGVVKMLQGITMAVKDSGSGGLGAMADEFSRIGDIMKAEPFQSRLSTIFDGARHGASAFNEGIKELGLTLGESSLFVANLLSQLGKLGGDALKTFSVGLRNLNFQSGVMDGLVGMNNLVITLGDGMNDLGNIVGNMSRIAGAAFSSIGPVINNVISLLDVVVGTLADNLVAVIPNLMGLVGGVIQSLSGPITMLAGMLNGVLGFINALPGPLAQITLAIAGLLLLGPKIGPMFEVKKGGLIEKLKYDFQQAETAGGKFGTVMKGLGAGALSAFGGPWGIAIGLVTAALGVFGAAQQQAAQDVNTLTDAIRAQDKEGLASAIYKQWSEIDSGPMENFWRDAGSLWTTGKKAANEAANSIGIDARRISDAIAAGQGETMAKDFDTLSKAGARFPPTADEIDAALGRLKLNMSGEEVKNHAADFGVLSEKVGSTSDKFGTAEYKAGEFGSALDKLPLDQSKQRLGDFNTAMGIYNDKTQTADSRTRALKTALDILSGKQPSLEEAQLKVNDAMRAAGGELANVNGQMVLTGGAFRDAQGNLLNFNGVINATTGQINTATTAGANLYRNLKDTTDGVLGTATAMKDAGRPVEEIAAYLDTARTNYIKMGVDAGLSADVVAAAYDHMVGANPKDLITTIKAQGIEEANSKLKNYKGALDEVDAYRAVAEIAGDDVVLGVKLADSYTKLGEWDRAVATATVNMNPEQADATKRRLDQDLIALAKTDPTVMAKMDPAILDRERGRIVGDLKELGNMKPTPQVKAEISDAQTELQTILNMLSNVVDKNVKIGVNTVYTETGPKPDGYVARNGIPAFQADGGLWKNNVQQFANGGFSQARNVKRFATGGFENHVAQIARGATPYRVWAEPETGGEAYIPLSVTKRARSTAILEQVAQQFGYNLTKAQTFADGGVIAGGNQKASSGLQVHIGTFNQNANDTIEDVGRGIMRQARNAGVTSIMEGI